ncbi:putative transcriptional regulator [marine actinobacterium PHSC20C1]|nr:putative transcriptional regulator [marine actinobacterium PHSC20C1]
MAIGTPATVALDALTITFVPHPYDHDSGTIEFGVEAATALGVDADQVFKTLMTMVDDDLVVAVVPVSGKLDLKALAAILHAKKAVMADPSVAQRRTGYVVGGISPIGQKTAHRTVIDETVELFETVFVSGGKRGFDIELAPKDLVRVTEATLAAIARSS